MINKLFLIATTIEELNEKLNNLSDKYLNTPWMGFVLFIGLLIIGYWAISGMNK